MKTIASVLALGLLLSTLSHARAVTASDAGMTAKATFLLGQLRDKISMMRTTGLVDFGDFKHSRIYGNSLERGWDTYYRCGNPHFRSRFGFGYDITPEPNSVTIMPSDSLYLGLTVASSNDFVASDHSIDLAPYLPGCRLYVFYRENLFGQSYLADDRPTPIESGIYRIIAVEMADVGVRIGKRHG